MAQEKGLYSQNRRFKLGRRRPVTRGPRLSFRNYLRAVLALPVAPPPSADYSLAAMSELDDIYLNNELSDCVIAAGYHMVAVATGNAGGAAFNPSSAEITKDYSAIGGYNPNAPLVNGENPTDQGCDEITALNYWVERGFADGTMGVAWVALNAADRSELETALYLFENVFLTLDLPDAYYGPGGQDAPRASGFTWDVAGPPNPDNGHAIVGVGYDSTGMKIATWGMLGTMTWAAVGKYCIDSADGGAYAMLTPDILNKAQKESPTGVDWNSLIDGINALGGNIPVISSPKAVSAVVNQTVSYKIVASNDPTSFSAENLPVGLTINHSTGVVTGKPTGAGKIQTTVTATNANGSGVAVVTFTVAAAAPLKIPAITSATTATATTGKQFSYRITASNSPTSFGASGLPASLSVNPATGMISGIPKSPGNVQITVSANNAAGKGSAVVRLTVRPVTPPPSTPTHTTPPHSSGTPPVSSSGVPPTSGDAMHFRSAWVPPPTYAIPPVPSAASTEVPASQALTDLGRQLLSGAQGSRKLGIVAASGIVIQGLLAIVSMTDDEPDKRGS